MPSVEELLSVAEADANTRSAMDSRIEIDYPRSPFEEGSGKYMKYTCYWVNGIKEGIGSN